MTLAVAGAGLWRMLGARSVREQALVWTIALVPLVAIVTLPFIVALARGAEGEIYRGLREWGLPMVAALDLLAVAALVTTRKPLARL